MAKQWMARRVDWAIVGWLAFTTLPGCKDETSAGTTSDETTSGGSGGTSGGNGGTATGGSGGTSGGAAGEAGGDGEAGSGGEAPATGGSGGTDSLNYVPVQRREDGLWPDLDQILPRELGDDDAKCRITQWASEAGEFIRSWTWQHNESNGQIIRLTYDTESDDAAAVFDENGHYWSVCDYSEPSYSRCTLFDEPRSVNWNDPDDYELTCPGTPPEGGFRQDAGYCSVPSSRDDACDGGLMNWQFTEDGQLRRFVPPARVGYADVDCYIDGVLRATGSQGDFSGSRHEHYPDGSLERKSASDTDHYDERYTLCDEDGWRAEDYVWERDLDSSARSITERYSFSGDDPLRPDEVVFEFEQTDLDCIPPIDRSGTLSATLEWTEDSVEVHPIASSDPSLADVTWSVELNPETLSARLDDAGNVVEIYPSPRSNLKELGIRELEPELAGVYTFEGEGDCARGTNPHLLVSTHGVLPYEYAPESCSTGQVTVTGYQQVCADYGPDE